MKENTIIQGDCLLAMKDMPDNCIDLTVTSPPYDNLREYKGYSFDFEGIAKELYRITKDGGVVVWVVGDATISGSETGTSFQQALYFKEIGFNIHDTMIYQKTGMSMPDTVRYYQNFEYMFVFSKGKPKTINLLKDKLNKWGGESSFGNVSSRGKDGQLIKRDKVITSEYGVRFNVWQYSTGYGYSTKDKIAFEHPAIFPDKLAEDHILSWSNKGDIVFDPFSGSGTTLKAAKSLGRNYLGCEISKEYVAIAEQRLQQQYLF